MDPLYGQRTTYPKTADIKNKWLLIDAENQILGRMSTQVAQLLLGKNKVNFQPGVPIGDSIVIINADKIKVTGSKLEQKDYIWHTGFIGGLKRRRMNKQMEVNPEEVILSAIRGMLPKNRYGRKLLKRVRVFVGAEHNLVAQNPTKVEV